MNQGHLRGLALAKSVLLTEAILDDPVGAAEQMAAGCPGVVLRRVFRCDEGSPAVAVIHLDIEPPEQFAVLGYPREHIALVVDVAVRIYPIGASSPPGRQFKHRNHRGDLCLFYRDDDPSLVWLPSDGVEALIAITQRHFAAEEYNRRYGVWPIEDAPHYSPPRGNHPIVQSATRRDVKHWERAN